MHPYNREEAQEGEISTQAQIRGTPPEKQPLLCYAGKEKNGGDYPAFLKKVAHTRELTSLKRHVIHPYCAT